MLLILFCTFGGLFHVKKQKLLDSFSHESHIVLPKEEFWLLKQEKSRQSPLIGREHCHDFILFFSPSASLENYFDAFKFLTDNILRKP